MAAYGLWAQSAAPLPLVRLHPSVLDAGGQPVTDLTAADFKIADQGKSQTILLFERPAATAAPPDPHEYTNRPGGILPHNVAILFDLLNEGDPNRLETWHSLLKSIPQLESAGQVYFYLLNLDGDLVPIHPVGPPGAGGAAWLGTFDKDLNKVMEGANGARPAGLDREDRAKRTYHQLEVVANQLATLPGRRDIVWITNLVPTITNAAPCGGDWIECGLYVAHLGFTLEQDGVAVNPDYASGVPQPTTSYDLDQMALLTGGHSYYLQDIREVLKQIARNAASLYTIAYAPSAANWDNKFHKIRIACGRKGVKMQVRERYYALRDTRTAAERQKEIMLAVYQRPSDSADIGLSVKVTPAPKSLHLDIRVDAGDLLLSLQNGKYTGALTVVLSDRDNSAGAASAGLQVRPLGEPSMSSFAVEMTSEQYDKTMRGGLEFSKDHTLGDAARMVRLIVMDTNTNAVGSLTFPVR